MFQSVSTLQIRLCLSHNITLALSLSLSVGLCLSVYQKCINVQCRNICRSTFVAKFSCIVEYVVLVPESTIKISKSRSGISCNFRFEVLTIFKYFHYRIILNLKYKTNEILREIFGSMKVEISEELRYYMKRNFVIFKKSFLS